MNATGVSHRRGAAIGLAVSVALAGCTAAAPTPQIIFVTPVPTPSPIIIYVTPPPTPTPATTPSPEPTPTPSPTPSSTPTPSHTSPAAACTGTADNKAFFAKAAGAMNWTVYCAVLPSGWSLTKGSYDRAPNGELDVEYQHGSAQLSLFEGDLCGSHGTVWCAWKVMAVDQGPAAFDHLAAELYLQGTNFIIDAGYGTAHEYLIFGAGLSQAQFVTYAAAVQAVPRP
jgi:hypothetical protein